MTNKIIITAPSLDTKLNVSGVSAITNFIIDSNPACTYTHFKLGKEDGQKRGLGWIMGIIGSFFSWCRLLLRDKEKAIHFNFALEKPSIIRDTPFMLAARLLNRKMIIHLHGGKFLMTTPPRWINWLLNRVLIKDQPVIVLSEFEKSVIAQRFNIVQITALPNCISLSEAKTFNRELPAGWPLNLLFIGRIVESKGMTYIYNACQLLKEKGIIFNLYLAGKGPEEEKYVPLFSALLGDSFIFKGVVSGVDKTELIKACDVFLLPSTYGEGLPIALLECMSFGLVPVVTDDGSMGQLITNLENGMMVKKHSANDIAGAIVKLDTDRQRLGAISHNAREYIFDNFDPDKYIDKLNALYNRL